jgi:multidrug efflux pump subunit AcrA (membrane-fusion protein)
MFGQMEIPMSGNSRGILLPNEAVIREDKNDFVFVMLNDTTFEKRLVETGIKQDNSVEISRGISPGERIVAKGVFFLKSEMLKSSFGEEE